MADNIVDFRDFKPPKLGKSTRWLVLGGIVLGGLGFLAFGSVFQIEPEEEGVILRFGEFNRTVEPGLHFKLPPPVETVWKVPTQRQLKEEFGFRTVEADIRTEYARASLNGEKLMLTGDLNVAVVEWIAQYRVKDPYQFLFKVRNVRSTFRDINEAVMRQIIGDRSVTEVLTIGRQEIEVEAQQLLQKMCDEYEMGIQVEQVVLQNVTPPDTVKPSFDEVNQAQQERERLINEAKTAFNRVIPAARGQAEETVAQARGYAIQRTNKAEGDASRFNSLRVAYEKSPVVTRKRLYLEAMSEVLPKAKKKVLISDEASGVLPLLQLEGGK
ncbi:MAG: FtsH protease activity modulator HflK [Myxococcota bacterium]